MDAGVNILCYKSKTLANGAHPLMIRVCKDGKKKYVSLGVSVLPQFWDFTKNQPKKNCPNKAYIEKIIADKSSEFAERIIELKAEIVHRELCEKCAALLDRYPGEYCIESFSPLALGWFKHHRPNVLRGQLATNHRGEGLKTPVIVREMLTYCMLNGFCKPDFIAYNCQFSNTLPVEMLRYFYKCKMAAWTIKNQGELNRHRKQFDVFIFDSFEPDQFVNFNKKHP